jgi:hypothetical protein
MVAEMLLERIGSGQLQDGAMLPRQEDVRLPAGSSLEDRLAAIDDVAGRLDGEASA